MLPENTLDKSPPSAQRASYLGEPKRRARGEKVENLSETKRKFQTPALEIFRGRRHPRAGGLGGRTRGQTGLRKAISMSRSLQTECPPQRECSG